MQTLILKSDNKKALGAIKALAKELDIESTLTLDKETSEYRIIKGVKIYKATRKLNVKESAGSLTDLHLEDAATLRKAWTRHNAS